MQNHMRETGVVAKQQFGERMCPVKQKTHVFLHEFKWCPGPDLSETVGEAKAEPYGRGCCEICEAS